MLHGEKMSLLDLFQKYGTDKAELGYAPIYEALFGHRRSRVLSVLEIGIGTLTPNVPSSMAGIKDGYATGASLRAWRDWFPFALIVGMDTQEDTMFTEPRIRTLWCDSTSSAVHTHLTKNKFDLVIDDGDHNSTAQIATLMQCWPLLKPDGVYVIEDVIGDYLFDTQDNLTAIVKSVPVFIRCSHTMVVVLTKPYRGA
jgi:hypothetical protein